MSAQDVLARPEPVRVSPAWLRLREPADAAARSTELADLLAGDLAAAGRLVIHDLGGGSGAMGRWLAPRLPAPQHWVVHDRDADLLTLAATDAVGPAADGSAITVEVRRSDITSLTPRDLDGASLVTASALLDLLTADELVRMLEACRGRPMLLTLTVVGQVTLSPPDPLDTRITAAFNAHQRRGGLLGPDAVAVAIEKLRGTGAEVLVQASPWRLSAANAELAVVWLDGWIAAACEQERALSSAAAANRDEQLAQEGGACGDRRSTQAGVYRDRRLAQAAAGELAVTVDHADLLVLP